DCPQARGVEARGVFGGPEGYSTNLGCSGGWRNEELEFKGLKNSKTRNPKRAMAQKSPNKIG
ncbi:unnamed protein product, partial [Dovyalis caffra]